MLKILCVIPSRIGSTRLPRKPLLMIQGKTMIQRVYENAKRCLFFTKVVVATDSHEIIEEVTNFGGNVEITSANIATGSDRVAAVATKYPEMEIIVNLQGDEPFVQPIMLEQLLTPYLRGEKPEMTTLAYPLEQEQDYHNPGIVKVVTNLRGEALYFSRSPIPYRKDKSQQDLPVYHHVGLYAFRRESLLEYTTLEQTPLEKSESLEQLRALEHGWRIQVCVTTEKTLEINTPEELAAAQNFPVGDVS